ncbi:MAG: M24 family metallopeptidase [Gemmata sp.]
MNYQLQRRSAIGPTFRAQGLDGFLVTAAVNVTYLTGFTGDSSYFAALPKHDTLISDTRFEEQVKEECPDLDAVIRGHNKTTLEAAAEVLTKAGARNVGVEGNRITLGELEALKALAPKVTFVPVNGVVEAQRAVKDPGEIERIREAVRVAERGFRMFTATLRESDSEKDMVDALEGYVRRAGARGTSFPPIIAVGDRGALPHAPPTARQIGEGSKLLVDWGADLLYKSDLTRTLRSPFGTAPSRRNKMERVGYDFDKLYAIVLAAQNAALAAIRPGAKARDVDAAARKVFATSKLDKHPDLKLADYFTHGLGHGIGLEIHEAPKIRANSDDVLAAGMVVTIEPGLYLPGWGGIRIEDDVLVTHDGYKMLSTLPREAATITAG